MPRRRVATAKGKLQHQITVANRQSAFIAKTHKHIGKTITKAKHDSWHRQNSRLIGKIQRSAAQRAASKANLARARAARNR